MNYLAHLFLSFEDPPIMVGNFVADEIRLANIPLVSREVQQGILLHREIDKYTDGHPAFKEAVSIFRADHRKYAPVIVDILNDHLLANLWGDYADQSLTDFEQYVYSSLQGWPELLPQRAAHHVEMLLEHQYLYAYASYEGIRGVMVRMDHRTRFPSDFAGAVDVLIAERPTLEGLFHELMTDLLETVPMIHEQIISLPSQE